VAIVEKFTRRRSARPSNWSPSLLTNHIPQARSNR